MSSKIYYMEACAEADIADIIFIESSKKVECFFVKDMPRFFTCESMKEIKERLLIYCKLKEGLDYQITYIGEL